MPETFIEEVFKGHKTCGIYYGEYQGEPQYLKMGLKKAQAILENIDQLRKWVDENERKERPK